MTNKKFFKSNKRANTGIRRTVFGITMMALAGISLFQGCKKDPEKPAPVITITAQPQSATVSVGSIAGSLSVTASVTEGAALAYQWYSNTAANNTGGEKETGATSASFTIPASLAAGTYYYFCEVSAKGATSVRSSAATVTVSAAPVKKVTVTGAQVGTMRATVAGETVTFAVTTENFANGAYDAFLADAPGVTVQGKVTIAANSGVLTLVGSALTVAGAYPYVSVQIETAVSDFFTLNIAPAPVLEKSLTVSEQSAPITEGATGSVYFNVSAVNFPTATYTATVQNLPKGVTVQNNSIEIRSDYNYGTLYLLYDATAEAGTYTLTLTVEGVVSNTFALKIDAKPVISFQGSGTAAAPYRIGTVQELKNLAIVVNAGLSEFNEYAVYYELTTDLNLNSEPWTPIKNFKSNLNGNHHKVTGLYIKSDASGVGFFGSVSGSVKNLGVEGEVTGGSYDVGGLAGSGVNITNCYTNVKVIGGQNVGGLAGLGGNITNCYTLGSVSGEGSVGGVIGYTSGTVTNCYATGAVSGLYSGGVAGYVDAEEGAGRLNDCAALNVSISGTGSGRVAIGSIFARNIAWQGMTPLNGATFGTGTASDKDGEPFTAAQIKADGTLGGRFTTTNGWTVENGKLPGFGAAVALPGHIQ